MKPGGCGRRRLAVSIAALLFAALAFSAYAVFRPPGDTGRDEAPVMFELRGYRIGLMICFDVHSMTEKLAKAGAELILWPVWWVDHDPPLWFDERLPDLCRRLHVAIAAANRATSGDLCELPGAGFSRIAGRDGEIVAEAKGFDEEIVIGRIASK